MPRIRISALDTLPQFITTLSFAEKGKKKWCCYIRDVNVGADGIGSKKGEKAR